MLATTIIQGAAVAVRDGEIVYQPRIDRGLLWDVTFRDRFEDSWATEVCWGDSKEAAFRRAPQYGRPFREEHVAPWFDREPTGWSPEQIAEAKRWAATIIIQRAS